MAEVQLIPPLKEITLIYQGQLSGDSQKDALLIKSGGMSVHEACIKNDMEALKAILSLGCDVNATFDDEHSEYHNYTPLGIASIFVNEECVTLLLEYGADPNTLDPKVFHPLAYLLSVRGGLNTNMKTYERKAHINIIKAFLKAGWEKDSSVDDEGNTLLVRSARFYEDHARINSYTVGKVIMDALLRQNVDINKANLNGITALMNLCMRGWENLKILI